ncbi:AAEL007513-PA [Aedes aegypti]|uniref:AAEL007513-PA n=1 Tax=Aedes aegypti TaxID=7159 RepID=Q171V3_AEDAE|nr:AAEL007513-PA [Aedes aegypti]
MATAIAALDTIPAPKKEKDNPICSEMKCREDRWMELDERRNDEACLRLFRSGRRKVCSYFPGAVGGDGGDDENDKEKEEEAERERQEAIREAEERRKEKHRKMEEEREKMRQEIRDKH